MSDDAMAERRERAKKILANPEAFKVCEGCESIVVKKAVTCPNCHGYRFDERPEAVVAQVKVLAERPQQSVTKEDML